MANARSTRWCFTINNPEAKALFTELPEGVRLVAWQRERGESGTEHFQGYIAFKNAKTLSSVKKFLGYNSAHCEIAKGTEAQAVAYVSKEETRIEGPWSLGSEAQQGKRSDLDEAAAEVMRTGKLDNVAPSLLVKYYKGFQTLALQKKPPIHQEILIFTIVGKTGVGKTWNIFNQFGDEVYRPLYGNSGIWWNLYTGQRVVLYDEFEGNCPLSVILQMTDGYRKQGDTKGAGVWVNPDIIFFTSNRHPSLWYKDTVSGDMSRYEQYQALRRRLTGLHDERLFTVNTREDMIQAWSSIMEQIVSKRPEFASDKSSSAVPDEPSITRVVDDDDNELLNPPPAQKHKPSSE